MPNPIDHLVFRARAQPSRPALLWLDKGLSFDQLLEQVRMIAARLRRIGVRPGQIAVTCVPARRVDWALTLALHHEGVITCSNHGLGSTGIDDQVDWVFTVAPVPWVPNERQVLVDREWTEGTRAELADISPIDYGNEDSVVRLVLTSGTTGHAKAVPFTMRTWTLRQQSMPSYWSSVNRDLNLMGLSTVGGYFSAMTALVCGAPYFCEFSPERQWAMIRKRALVSLTGSPAQLAAISKLAANSESASARSLRIVRSGGGPLSQTLLENLRRRLCPTVLNVYGSTEVGGVCIMDATASDDAGTPAGYVRPGTAAEVVDDTGQPVPPGEDGSVRLRSPCMPAGYYGNEVETQRSFRDGWFYPGDRGRFLDNGLLVLGGRDLELINSGGVKVDPTPIESFLVDLQGVRDAAVFGVENDSGVQEVWAAVVLDDGFSVEGLHEQILARFGAGPVPVAYCRLAEIPRNQMGKPMRVQLGRQMRAQSTAQHPDHRMLDHRDKG